MQDEVEKPEHYQFGQMEAWDIIELALIGTHDPVTAYHAASALKYLLRAARKNGAEDIAKACAHLKRETARHVTAAPDYDPSSVASRHVDLGRVCGSHTIPPHVEYFALNYGFAPSDVDKPRADQSRHPMHAEAIRVADETPWRLP